MSGKKYERLKTIATKAVPEVKELLNEGELTQAAALELVKLDDDEQREIVEKHKDVKDIKKYIRQKGKQAQRKDFAFQQWQASTSLHIIHMSFSSVFVASCQGGGEGTPMVGEIILTL